MAASPPTSNGVGKQQLVAWCATLSQTRCTRLEDLKSGVVLLAVLENGLALQYASRRLRRDREICVSAVRGNGMALRYVHDSALRDARECVLAAVESDGSALAFASHRLRADRGIVLAAARNSYGALRHASRHGSETAPEAAKPAEPEGAAGPESKWKHPC